MSHKPGRTILTLTILALGFMLTGCGSGEGTKVASGTDSQPSAQASSASPSLKPEELGVKFAQCLREHGLDVADPEPGKGVRLRFDGPQAKETAQKAMEACREFDPQAQSTAGADPQREENGRKFAACMRQNGVEAFPDPKPGQRGIMINETVAKDPDLKKAQAACEGILAGGGR